MSKSRKFRLEEIKGYFRNKPVKAMINEKLVRIRTKKR